MLEAVRVTCFKYVAAILEIVDLSLSLHSLFYTEPSSEIHKLCQNCVGKIITRTVLADMMLFKQEWKKPYPVT